MKKKQQTHVPRITLGIEEAAESIGCSRSTFYTDVLPHLRVVRIGRRQFVPWRELERWADENAAMPLADELRRMAG